MYDIREMMMIDKSIEDDPITDPFPSYKTEHGRSVIELSSADELYLIEGWVKADEEMNAPRKFMVTTPLRLLQFISQNEDILFDISVTYIHTLFRGFPIQSLHEPEISRVSEIYTGKSPADTWVFLVVLANKQKLIWGHADIEPSQIKDKKLMIRFEVDRHKRQPKHDHKKTTKLKITKKGDINEPTSCIIWANSSNYDYCDVH